MFHPYPKHFYLHPRVQFELRPHQRSQSHLPVLQQDHWLQHWRQIQTGPLLLKQSLVPVGCLNQPVAPLDHHPHPR